MEFLPTLISWLHTLTAASALLLGGYILFAKKGTKNHLKIGQFYLLCMILTNISALFIYTAFGKWFFPHTLAVITLVVLAIGIYFSRKRNYKHWIKIHLSSFIFSYYMLIGGGINEAFLRIKPLQPYFYNNAQIVGLTHFVAMVLFTVLILYYLVVKNLKKL